MDVPPRLVLIKYLCRYKETLMPMQINTRLLVWVASSSRDSRPQEGLQTPAAPSPVCIFLHLHHVSGKCQGNVDGRGLPTPAPELNREGNENKSKHNL